MISIRRRSASRSDLSRPSAIRGTRSKNAFLSAPQGVKGKVTNLVPYGAFIEIEEGVEGLIHVSELSWTKRITRLSDRLTLKVRKLKRWSLA